jgi:hypothetical protein
MRRIGWCSLLSIVAYTMPYFTALWGNVPFVPIVEVGERRMILG